MNSNCMTGTSQASGVGRSIGGLCVQTSGPWGHEGSMARLITAGVAIAVVLTVVAQICVAGGDPAVCNKNCAGAAGPAMCALHVLCMLPTV